MYRRGLGTYMGWPICGSPGTVNIPVPTGMSGLRRGLGCGCGCGKCSTGLGQIDTVVNVTPTGGSVAPANWYQSLFPSGALFGSGFDISGWGIPEWAVVFLGAYVLFSVASTTRRVGRRAKRAAGAPGRAYRRVRKSVRRARARTGQIIAGDQA